MSDDGQVGSIDWFLKKEGGTPEEQALKRKAWEYMEYGAYDQGLKILWENFPDEYPIPDCEKAMYRDRIHVKRSGGKTDEE